MRKYWMTALAVALGALLGGALYTTPASATPPKLEQSAALTADCGEVTLTFVNNHSGWTYTWNVQTSDGQNFNVDVPSDESPKSTVVTLEPGVGSGWVSYGTVSGPESDYYLANRTKAVSLCEPASPSATPSVSPSPSTSPSPTPSPEPTVTESPTPSASPAPSASPTPGATAEPSTTPSEVEGEGGEQLPVTGASLPYVVGAGAALLGLGTGVVLLTRKRKQYFINE